MRGCTGILGPAVRAVVLLVLEFVACVGAVHFSPEGSTVSTWWPAAGIAVALLLVSPPRWAWPLAVAVALVSAGANVVGGRPWDLSLGFGLFNGLEAWVATWVLRRRRRSPRLETQADVARLGAAAAAGAVVIGLGAASLVWAQGGEFLPALRNVLPSHAASTLVIVPLVLSLRAPRLRDRPQELFLQTALLAVAFLAVFAPAQELALASLPLPLLTWAAFRFGQRTVSWQIVAVAVIVTSLTAAGHGPFAATSAGLVDPQLAGGMTQAYLVTLVLLCLPLAVSVQQSLRLTEQLRASSELFRHNFADSLVAMLVLRSGPDGLVVLDANRPAAELTGHDLEDLVEMRLDELVVTDSSLEEATRRLHRGDVQAWRDEGSLPHRPRSRVALSLARLAGRSDERLFSAQLLDLTAERAAKADLDEERQLSEITVATAACLILVSDLDGTVLRANPAVTEILGLPVDEVVGRPVWESVTPPEHRETAAEMFRVPGGAGVPRSVETTAFDADGGEHRVAWTSGVVNDASGEPAYVVMTGLDITAERNAAGLMQHLLQAALSTAVIGMDTSGTITLFNSGARELLQRQPAEAVGTRFVDVLLASELDAWAARRGAPATFETLVEHVVDQPAHDWTWCRADGQPTLVSMSLSRVTDHGGTLIGYLCVGTDVTETRQNQELLVTALDKERQVVERLQHLDAAKDEFVSTVSHELRTPVSSIVGYAELLQEGDFGEVPYEQAPVLDAISRNGERLITLVDNLLALNSLASDSLDWDRSRMDLAELVRSAVADQRPTMSQHRLDLQVDVTDGPVWIEGDRPQLARVLDNLFSNAVKFTDRGGRVTCCLAEQDGDVVLTIGDDGLGIPEDEQANLFKRFWRSSTAQSRHVQGTGLGLSIVQAIVTAHEGTVEIESGHLAGTTVTVRLPGAP